MITNYKTLIKPAVAEISEKRSRFICAVSPVDTEEEAVKFVDFVKKREYNANHNVYAYVIMGDETGSKNDISRFSDDGEPSGTAGIPILTLMQNEGIKNAVIVVTRYFGGTLLGAGGLIRAYTAAAKAGFTASGIAVKDLYGEYTVEADYSLSGRIKRDISKAGFILTGTTYSENVVFTVLVSSKPGNDAKFIEMMTDITSGTAKITKVRDVWF